MKKLLILLFLWGGLLFSGQAQKDIRSSIDSLQAELALSKSGDSFMTIAKLYQQIGLAYEQIHNDSGIAWYKQELKYLKNQGLVSSKADSVLGAVYLDLAYLLVFISYSGEEDLL